MADSTSYKYTRIDDLSVLTSYTPTVTVNTLLGTVKFKFKWKTNSFLTGKVTGQYKLYAGQYREMDITGGNASGEVVLTGNGREKLTTLEWNAFEDILPQLYTNMSLKLEFTDGTRTIPVSESETEWTGQTFDFRKQVINFTLNGHGENKNKSAFGYDPTPEVIFYTPKFLKPVIILPTLEKSVDSTFASVDTVTAFEYSDDNGATYTTGNASNGNAMDDPLKIRMTPTVDVADDATEFFRVRLVAQGFVL